MIPEMFSPVRFLFCAVDIYMLYRFFKSMFPERVTKQKLLIGYILLTLSAYIINSFGIFWLNLILVPAFYIIFVIYTFNISSWNSIVYTVVFYTIFAGGEFACVIIYSFFVNNYIENIPVWFLNNEIYLLLISYILRFLFLLFLEKFTIKLDVGNNGEFSWYLMIVPITSIIVLNCFLYMDFPDSFLIQGLVCSGALLLYFTNAVVFIMLGKLTVIMNRIKYEELYSIRQLMEDERFQNITKLNESYRCYMHDMHTYLSNLYTLSLEGKNEVIARIIDEIEGNMQEEVDTRVYCGNEVLNAIFVERSTRARNKGVNLSIFVENFLKVDFISDTDMISMFGNLLDNALEAAEQCEDTKKNIDVKLFMGNQYMLVLYIENNYRKVIVDEGGLRTTKEDPDKHGYGIGIVRKLAEKYGGALTLEENGEVFITTLTISAQKT